jgi:monofunctional biosynthetic peptidoglycan transglycosylase
MAGKKRKRSRILKFLLLIGLSIFAASALVVLIFRFVPPPFSALMVQRRIESWSGTRNYNPRYDWTPLDRIAPVMGAAVIAAEDQTFADHFGFDWKAIEKAIEHNENSKRVRGASTLSQQTAKNLFLPSGRTWTRKGLEAYFTLLMEMGWSKRRILEVYLNIVEFGDGVYGVESASQAFFGKPAARLSPSEAALLAAVLPNPHLYKVKAPSGYVRERQQWILDQMANLGGPKVVRELK